MSGDIGEILNRTNWILQTADIIGDIWCVVLYLVQAAICLKLLLGTLIEYLTLSNHWCFGEFVKAGFILLRE